MSTVCGTERSPVRAALARGVAGPAQGPAARHGRLQVRSLGLALEASSHTPTIWTQPRTPIPPLPPALRALRSLAPLPVKDETAQSTGGGGGHPNPGVPGQDGATRRWDGASAQARGGRRPSSDARGASRTPRQRVAARWARHGFGGGVLDAPRHPEGDAGCASRPGPRAPVHRLGGRSLLRAPLAGHGGGPAALIFELHVLNAY